MPAYAAIALLLLPDVVHDAILGRDDSVTGGLLAAAALVARKAVVVRVVSLSECAIRLFEGTDVPLVRDGGFLERSLWRDALGRVDVEAALRGGARMEPTTSRTPTSVPGGGIAVQQRSRGSPRVPPERTPPVTTRGSQRSGYRCGTMSHDSTPIRSRPRSRIRSRTP
jgi:hypothetical protein